MVECQLPKLDVAGSSPVSRSIFSITTQDQEAFFDALTSPPAPSRNLLKAAGRYKRLGL